MEELVVIDGSAGEGGGQVLRTSLALSLVTGRPVRVDNVRAGRKRPGLMRQHLTALEAAARVGGARVTGAEIGSRQVTFAPAGVHAGAHEFAVGTAGSTTLVLQTVLPPLLVAAEPSVLRLRGGTHNPMAPPFDFLERAFLPLVARMGPRFRAELIRPGFYPAGGGECLLEIEPVARLAPLALEERGPITRRLARATVSRLPRSIAERELAVVERLLGWEPGCTEIAEVSSPGPGNVLSIELGSACGVTEVVTGFGEKGLPAEAVAEGAAREARRYLAADVPVGEHLADQLLLPMALSGAGSFVTLPLSRHATTNIDVLKAFLPVEVTVERAGERCRVTVRS